MAEPAETHSPIQTWFKGRPIARSEVLAWEARRAAKTLRQLGAPLPDGDVHDRRSALLAAKTTAGRPATEKR